MVSVALLPVTADETSIAVAACTPVCCCSPHKTAALHRCVTASLLEFLSMVSVALLPLTAAETSIAVAASTPVCSFSPQDFAAVHHCVTTCLLESLFMVSVALLPVTAGETNTAAAGLHLYVFAAHEKLQKCILVSQHVCLNPCSWCL